MLGHGFGFIGHPVQFLNAFLERGHQVINQFFHLHLGLGREMAVDINPANAFTQRRIDNPDPGFPAFRLFLQAVYQFTHEVKVGVLKLAGKKRRFPVHGLETQIIFPSIKRSAIDNSAQRLEITKLGNHQFFTSGKTSTLEESLPVNFRCHFFIQICGVEKIVESRNVTILNR